MLCSQNLQKQPPPQIFKPGGALDAPVLDPPLLRPKEFYRAGTAPPGFEIPGSATESEWNNLLRQMLTIAKADN